MMWNVWGKTRQYIRKIVTADELLQDGGTIAIGMIIAGAFNYLYQLFIGRLLGPRQYGIFGALFSIFYLVNIVGSGIQFSATRFMAEFDERGGGSKFHRGLFRRAFIFSLVVFVSLALGSPLIDSFLDIGSPWPIVVVAMILPFTLTVKTNFGSFQGLQWFTPLAFYEVIQAGMKLLIGVGLVLLGFGIYGAFSGIVIAGAVSLLITTYHLRSRLDPLGDLPLDFDYYQVYRYVSPSLLAGFCLTVPATMDVIVVKYVSTDAQTGLYTAASVLGKMLIFLPMGISSALFPKVTNDSIQEQSVRTQSLLERALLYSATIAGVGTVVFWSVPRSILGLLFGEQYVVAAPLLRWYGLAIFWFVLAVVVLQFELARDRMRFVHVFTVASIIEVALMWIFHDPLVRIVQIILLVNVILFVFGLFTVRRH